jgi:zinc protease
MTLSTSLRIGLLGLAVAAASSCVPENPKFAFHHAEQRGTLTGNGLRFVIMPDTSTDLVEVDVRYQVGSREDPPGKAGLAHLVEHMMFQLKLLGADKPPVMHITNQLSTFFNAYTNWDTTHYMTTARKTHFEDMLGIEAKRLELGCKTISEDEFLREREVVRNEIRQRGGTAEGQIPQLVMSDVYPKGHAYERMIGGDDTQLTSITLKDACDWIAKYYVPENATVIVAGGVTIDEATRGISKWFGGLEKRAVAPRVPVAPVVVTPGRKTIELDIERPQLAVTWALPASNTREGEAAQWGLGQAFGGVASKAEEYGFAYSVQPMVVGGAEAPIFTILLELKGMDKVGEAISFINKITDESWRGFRDIEWQQLEELKNQQKASFIEGIESLTGRTNTMGEMVQFEKDFDFNSTDIYFFHALDKIDRTDGEFIGGVIKRVIDPDKARITIFKPSAAGIKGDKRAKVVFQTKSHDTREVAEVDPAEAARPIKVAAELKALDGATRFELGNGMKVVLLESHAMPLISARLDFAVGDAHAPDAPLLPTAAASLLRTNAESEALYRTGIGINCASGPDTTSCRTSGVSIYLDVMIKGLERQIKAGEYSQTGIERWQRRMRDAIKTQAAQTEQETERQIATAMFGPEHPYTKTSFISSAAIGQIGRDRLDGFRNTHYTAGNATLVVVGDFETKKAEALIRGAFGGWGKGHVDAPIAPTPYARTGPVYVGVIGKAEPQMAVRIGYPAPAGVDGQEGARRVLAEMLNIRMGDIRFKLGATYGTYAFRQPAMGPSAYWMGGTVDAARAGEALRAMRDGVDKLRAGDGFAIDFVRARRKILTELLGESTVTAELGQRLMYISRYGLAPAFYNKLLQQVAAASPAQIRELIASELNPAFEVVVTQADKATLEKAFADAGITDVKLVEPDAP